MRAVRVLLALAAGALLVACSDATRTTGPTPAFTASGDATLASDAWYAPAFPGAVPFRLFQQNAYPGTNVDIVIGAPPEQRLVALGAALQKELATKMAERADRIAEEVARQQPDVITLNEAVAVAWKNLQPLPSVPFPPGMPNPYPASFATLPDDSLDFLPLFQQALAARQLDYVLVAQRWETDLLLPLAPPELVQLLGFLPYVHFRDSDVMLVRRGTGVANVVSQLYQARFAIDLGAGPVEITRGWIAADLNVRGRTVRMVLTHPESDVTGGTALRDLQVQELFGTFAGVTLPIVVTGDLNFRPYDAPYAQFLEAGFKDAWKQRVGAPLPEFTSSPDDDLADPNRQLTDRLDYVFVRPDAAHQLGPVQFTLFGDQLSERTVSGLWVSDHAGLLVGFVLVPRK